MIPTLPTTLRTVLRTLRDRRGVAALEFAVALPVLIMVLLGIIDVASYVTTSNRLQRVASEVGNVGAQFDRLRKSMVVTTGNEVGVLFLAAREIGKPMGFPTADEGAVILPSEAAKPVKQAPGGVIVTCVTDQGKGARIAWQAYAGVSPVNSRFGTGTAAVTLPEGFTLRQGDSALFVEVFYTLQPYLLSGDWTGTGNPVVTAYANAVFRPRMGALTTLDP